MQILDQPLKKQPLILNIVECLNSSLNLNCPKPELTENGTSGSYFLSNQFSLKLAIFKPSDEEPFTPNNPKGYQGVIGQSTFRKGIQSGEQCHREVAAYLLDYQNEFQSNFHNVPPTTLIEMNNRFFKGETKGSLQNFVEHDDAAYNYGQNIFSVEEVHKIAILDIRILNADRNDENILIKKENIDNDINYKLIPIDHGLSFPDCFEICQDNVIWMEWEQAKKPFTAEELEFIKNIDILSDVQAIKKQFIGREECLVNFKIASTLLKIAALKGLSLYNIGQILYREDEDIPAKIEEIIKNTDQLYTQKQQDIPEESTDAILQQNTNNKENQQWYTCLEQTIERYIESQNNTVQQS